MSQVPTAQHMDSHTAVCLAAAKGMMAPSTSPLWLDRAIFPGQGLPQGTAGDAAGLQSCLQTCSLLLNAACCSNAAWSRHLGM